MLNNNNFLKGVLQYLNTNKNMFKTFGLLVLKKFVFLKLMIFYTI